MKLLKIGLVVNAANDPGYETIIQVLSEPEILEICTPVVFGLQEKISQAVEKIAPEQQAPVSTIDKIEDVADGKINIFDNCGIEIEALKLAIASYMGNGLDIIIDIPTEICNNKKELTLSNLVSSAIEAERTDVFDWSVNGCSRALALHKRIDESKQSEAEASDTFTKDITTINKSLRKDYTLIKPRIAIVSKDKTIHDKLAALREHGVFAFGPFAADDFIANEKYKPYDATVFFEDDAAYNKMQEALGKESAYGYISGLPMVITYLHSDAAPDVQTLKDAIYASLDIHRNRIRYRIATSHPLEKQWVPRGRDDFKLDLSKEESDS